MHYLCSLQQDDKKEDKDNAIMVKNLPYNTHLFLKGMPPPNTDSKTDRCDVYLLAY
jgi:hypothetical protein